MSRKAMAFQLSPGLMTQLENMAEAEHCEVFDLILRAVNEFLYRQEKQTAGKGKPACSDFIIATIRRSRHDPKSLKPGAHSGVALRNVWKIAAEMYTEQEFRESLMALLENKEVIIIGGGFDEERNSEGETGRFVSFHEIIFCPGNDFPLGEKCVCLDMEGHPVYEVPKKEGAYRVFTRVRLYVVADGLSGIALNALSRSRGGTRTTAHDVIKSMRMLKKH